MTPMCLEKAQVVTRLRMKMALVELGGRKEVMTRYCLSV